MAFRRILVAVDGSKIAGHALDVAVELARSTSAELALVHAVDPLAAYVPIDPLDTVERVGDEELASKAMLARLAASVGAPSPETFLVRGSPPEEVARMAERWHADLVVIGTHGRKGVSRALLGSVAEATVRRAPCPVLVVREPKRP